MARAIDAEELKKYCVENGEGFVLFLDKLFEMIDKQPTIDPVKHGKWERIPYSFAGGYRCSCCGQKSLERHWNYCPNCGARMDGE